MPEPYPVEINIQYNETLRMRAARTYNQGNPFWKRSIIAILLFEAVALILGVVIILKYYPPSAWPYPDQVLAVTVLSLLPLLWWWSSRRLAKQIQQRHTGRISFGAETFCFQCDLADSEIHWKLFYKLQTGPDVWLLFPSPLTFYALPVEALTPEMQDYILARLRENGVPIRRV